LLEIFEEDDEGNSAKKTVVVQVIDSENDKLSPAIPSFINKIWEQRIFPENQFMKFSSQIWSAVVLRESKSTSF